VAQLRDRLTHKIKTEEIAGSSSMASSVKLLKFRSPFKLLSLPSERCGKKRRLDLLTGLTANEREKGRVQNAGNALGRGCSTMFKFLPNEQYVNKHLHPYVQARYPNGDY